MSILEQALDSLTLAEVDEAVGRTIARLEALTRIRSALAAEDHERVRALLRDYQSAQRKGSGSP